MPGQSEAGGPLAVLVTYCPRWTYSSRIWGERYWALKPYSKIKFKIYFSQYFFKQV